MDQMANLIIQVATLAINPSRVWPFPAGVLRITFKMPVLALGSAFCHSHTVSDILYYRMMNFLLVLFCHTLPDYIKPQVVFEFSLGLTVTELI